MPFFPVTPQNKGLVHNLMVASLLFYWLFAWYINDMDLAGNPPSYLQPVQALPGSSFIFFILELFSPRVLFYVIPFGLGWYFSHNTARAFVQDLFDLPNAQVAAAFLARLQTPESPAGGSVQIRRKEFALDRYQHPLLHYGGPGTVVVGQGDAIITERNGRFQRVVGPGSHVLRQYEYVRSVVDLRTHERTNPAITLYSKDGIEIRTTLTVTYRISRGDKQPHERDPFPFEEDAVRRAAYTEFLLENGNTLNWESFPLFLVISKLREVASKRTLDRLLYLENPELKPHELLKERMDELAQIALKEIGVDLVGTRLGRLEVPDAVTQQRIEFWQAYWDRRRREKTGEGEAQAHLQLETARAQAKAGAIRHMMQEFQHSSLAGQNGTPRELMAMRLVEAMQKMTRRVPAGSGVHELADRLEKLKSELEENNSKP